MEKLIERKKYINEALSGKNPAANIGQKVTDSQLFRQLGKKMKVIKKN